MGLHPFFMPIFLYVVCGFLVPQPLLTAPVLWEHQTKTNLRFLIGVRHEIEHQMTDKIDEFLSAKLQACALNFDYYICKLFGDKYNLSKELSLAIQFSPLTPEQRDTLHDNSHITSNVKNFVVDFEDVLVVR